ncbi:MAG TPA: hypothetical protein VFC78_08675, partial [Tepidisphaeraceae bacterium]|nr:hypothetical protein [Tepidisphaeraceae bacterium]
PQAARPAPTPAPLQPPRPSSAAPGPALKQAVPRMQAPVAIVPQSERKTAARTASADAAALRRWLRPATLHHQFILTEVFLPPVGLRDQ